MPKIEKGKSAETLPEQVRTPVDANGSGSKGALYADICQRLDALIGEERNLVANLANTAALLYESLPEVNWVGFYLADGGGLVLGPFQGKPACVRIAAGKGVCGRAAREECTVVVPDVSKFRGHIVCDPASRSEIVVPLINWGRLVGVLDVDSARLGRFDEDDQEGLESVAAVLLASLDSSDMPDFHEASAEA